MRVLQGPFVLEGRVGEKFGEEATVVLMRHLDFSPYHLTFDFGPGTTTQTC